MDKSVDFVLSRVRPAIERVEKEKGYQPEKLAVTEKPAAESAAPETKLSETEVKKDTFSPEKAPNAPKPAPAEPGK